MTALVTGGSGSGKSAWAEDLLCALCPGPKYYLAAMPAQGPEAQARIARHRRMRSGKGFRTLECADGLTGLSIPEGASVLLEDLSNLAADLMFAADPPADCAHALWDQLSSLLDRCTNVVVVSNEIFSDGIGYGPEMEAYLALLGGLNVRLARRADLAVEVVCGLPLVLKGDVPCSMPS